MHNPMEDSNKDMEPETRSGGMLVQRREKNYGDENGGPMFKIKVSYGSSLYNFTVPCIFTFGILHYSFLVYTVSLPSLN